MFNYNFGWFLRDVLIVCGSVVFTLFGITLHLQRVNDGTTPMVHKWGEPFAIHEPGLSYPGFFRYECEVCPEIDLGSSGPHKEKTCIQSGIQASKEVKLKECLSCGCVLHSFGAWQMNMLCQICIEDTDQSSWVEEMERDHNQLKEGLADKDG